VIILGSILSLLSPSIQRENTVWIISEILAFHLPMLIFHLELIVSEAAILSLQEDSWDKHDNTEWSQIDVKFDEGTGIDIGLLHVL
jgi:hypothetical protein